VGLLRGTDSIFIYRQFNIQQFYVLSTQFTRFVWIWKQTAIISLYKINWLVFITEKSGFTARYGLYL